MLNSMERRMTHPLQLTSNLSTVRSSSQLGQPVNIQPNPCLYCIYCNSANHSSHQCERFKNSTKYWEKVSVDRRCKNCLRLYHKSNKCYDRSFCFLNTCNRLDKHSPTLCHARYVKYYYNTNGHNLSKRNSRFGGMLSHQKFMSSKINYNILPKTRSFEQSHSYSFLSRKPSNSRMYMNENDSSSSNHTSKVKGNSQPENLPSFAPGVNMSTQTLEMEKSEDINFKKTNSIGCQTESCLVDVSVQTRVIIPASQRIYNDIPAGMVDKVDVKSIGYVIRNDEKIIDSNVPIKDQKIIPQDSTKKEEKIITCASYPSQMNVPSAKHCFPANQRGENQIFYSHSTQSSVGPFISFNDVAAKAKDQAIRGFRNFSLWK